MCQNKCCPLREGCFRYKATPSPYWQSYSIFEYQNGHCDYYEPLEDYLIDPDTWYIKEEKVKDIEKSITKGGHPMFYELIDKMKEIHDAKNADYAGDDPLSNFNEAKKFGITAFQGVLVRLSDKY